MKRKWIMLLLLPIVLYAEDPVVRNEYLDTSTGLWLVEGSCGYIICKSSGASHTMSFVIPVSIAVLKEWYVDNMHNDIFGLWEEPDVIGFDPADICFSIVGTMLGFIVNELWDNRFNIRYTQNQLSLSYTF
jgi:hypothetical protein